MRRTILVTGATNGIGQVAARRLAQPGTTIILTARDAARGAAEVEALEARGAEAHLVIADFDRSSDVRRLITEVRTGFGTIDLLLANAGALFTERGLTEDGFERTIAVNHLAPFLLTLGLFDRFSPGARLVVTASAAHLQGDMHWDDLTLERGYNRMGFTAYCRSKLCNLWFTLELARRVPAARLTCNAVHPGYVGSAFGQNNGGWFARALKLGAAVVARTPEQGARGLLYAADSPELAGVTGVYLKDHRVLTPSAKARDAEQAQRCWAWSLAAVGWASADPTTGAL